MYKIDFLSGDYPIFNSPFIQNLNGFLNDNHFESNFLNSDKKENLNSNRISKVSKLKKKLSKFKLIASLYRMILYDLNFISRVKLFSKDVDWNRTSNIIAIEKFGLFLAYLNKKRPIIYISLESNYILHSESISEFILNIFEKFYLFFYDPPVICTSYSRLNVITFNNLIKLSNFFILPVCASYVAHNFVSKSNYLRQKYLIKSDIIIVLIAGTMGHSLVEDILDTIDHWSDEFVLVLHSPNGSYSEYIKEKASLCNKIILSFDSFSIEDAEKYIYGSSDISIIMYPNNSINYRLTAYSSGKLAASAKFGLPVLVPNFKEFNELIDDYGFGICSSTYEIPENLKMLKLKYEHFSKEAYRAYNDIYKFDNYSYEFNLFLNKCNRST